MENVAQFLPTRAGVHITTLKLLDRRWENVVVDASQTDRKWQANVTSNQVSGDVAWTTELTRGSPGALQAQFAKVVIPEKTEGDMADKIIRKPLRSMPSIDLTVNELVFRGRDLGRLEVDAHNDFITEDPVWTLDKLELANSDATLSADATWRTPGHAIPVDDDDDSIPRRTSVNFRLDVKNGGQLIDRFGLPHTVNKGDGTVSGRAGWNGGPTTINMTTLDGNVNVDLHHGQILRAPGAAKWLGTSACACSPIC